MKKNETIVPVAQVVELGNVTELTLGTIGWAMEGKRPFIRFPQR